MAEWHVTPDYIVGHWTDELFVLMVDSLASRRDREREAMSKGGAKRTVSNRDMFRMIGAEVKGGH